MILIALRILFGAALGYTIYEAWKNGQTNLERGDILNAYYLALAVGLAMLNAVVWAPFFGSKLSDPLTGTITKSTYVERHNYFLRFIRWLDNRGYRVLTRWLCFIEGVRHPSQPTQFVLGLNNARPGSWLEKVYALEVFRFGNVQNCVQAYHVLRRRGLDPRPHANHEVNIVLMSLEREVRPEPQVLVIPKAPGQPAPLRNPRIKLFEGAPEPVEAGAADKQQPPVQQQQKVAPEPEPVPATPPHIAWLHQMWARIWRFIETH